MISKWPALMSMFGGHVDVAGRGIACKVRIAVLVHLLLMSESAWIARDFD